MEEKRWLDFGLGAVLDGKSPTLAARGIVGDKVAESTSTEALTDCSTSADLDEAEAFERKADRDNARAWRIYGNQLLDVLWDQVEHGLKR